MKRLHSFLFLFILLSGPESFSQSFRKYPIGNSGCSAYNYCDSKWDISKSPDSSTVYSGECVADGLHYAVICVKLQEPVTDLSEAETMLEGYLNYLKTTFDIVSAAGYGKGHRLQGSEKTRGMVDYWKDKDGDNWKIKGWSNGKFIGVMMVYGSKELPENKVNSFLDGFRLPGM